MAEQFSFEGIDVIEDRIQRHAEEIGYLVLLDRTDYRHEQKLGRIDFTAEALAPYLPEGLSAEEIDSRELAAAAMRYVRELAEQNTLGEESVRFRLRVYGPKAAYALFSATFICRNHGIVQEQEPLPSLEEAEEQAMSQGVRALGDYYRQFARLVLGSMGQLQEINNSMLDRLHAQLKDSQHQVDELMGAMLDVQVEQLRIKIEEAGDAARTALAREAVAQIGQAAQAYLLTQGLDPELTEVLAALSQSPELMEALKDPQVRELMKDPKNLRDLAAMLKQAAALQSQPQSQQLEQASAQQAQGASHAA